MALLELNGVESGYGKIPILHEVNLEVEEREIVAILGPNGAGKSTLLKTIFGLLPLKKGSIRFKGRDLRDCRTELLPSLGMAYVPQEGHTFPDLTVEENLILSIPTKKRTDTSLSYRMTKLFPRLRERSHQRAKTLSGGERQMLALAGGMIGEPLFLALDEPTAGLAPSIVDDLVRKVLEFREGGATILWVIQEHPERILRDCDRVHLLQAGRISDGMDSSGLLKDGAVQDVIFGRPS